MLSVPCGSICTNRESRFISSHCATLANYKTYRDWSNIAIHSTKAPPFSPLCNAGIARLHAIFRRKSRGIDTRTYKNTIQTFITVSSLIALRIRVPCRGCLSSNVVALLIYGIVDLDTGGSWLNVIEERKHSEIYRALAELHSSGRAR